MTATEETGADPTRSARSRTLLWILGVAVLLALVVGAVAGALREPATLDPTSPEGVVQEYLRAVLDDDYTSAVEFLSARTAERCPASAFREAWIPGDLIADLDEVRVRDGRAEVRVQVRSTSDPLLLESVDSSIETFVLIDEDGSWRITDDPWPLYTCRPPE